MLSWGNARLDVKDAFAMNGLHKLSIKNVVVIGASGQLGSDLVIALRGGGFNVVGADHAQIDIESTTAVAALIARFEPDLLINTAAFHNVERCETHSDRAFAVNATAVDGLAIVCAIANIALLHVSTDYVFAGDKATPYVETDAPRPRSVYGISKYSGELLAASRLEKLWIVRTSGLYGVRGSTTKGYTFIERVREQAKRGEPVRVVDDIVFSPSYTVHVARAICEIVSTSTYGTYHVTNGGHCSWYEFAKEVFSQIGVSPDLRPTTSAAFPTYAKRPTFSALDHEAMRRAGLRSVPSWQDGIRDYLASKADSSLV